LILPEKGDKKGYIDRGNGNANDYGSYQKGLRQRICGILHVLAYGRYHAVREPDTYQEHNNRHFHHHYGNYGLDDAFADDEAVKTDKKNSSTDKLSIY